MNFNLKLKLYNFSVATALFIFVSSVFGATLFFQPLITNAATEIPDEFKKCIPIVNSFSTTPAKVTKRDQSVKMTVTVRTLGCIIGNVNGKSPMWNVFAEVKDETGKSDGGFVFPSTTTYMSGADFKQVNKNAQHPDFNKYDATYTRTVTNLFENLNGNTLTISPNLRWDDFTQVINTGLAKKVTAGGAAVSNTNANANANTNTGNPNENINTDVSSKFDKGLDEKIGDFWNPLQKDTLPELLATILRILFALIGMVAVIIIIISGFRMVLASGNETELTKAKAAITWAIVGLIVSLMAFSIVAIIQRLIQTRVG